MSKEGHRPDPATIEAVIKMKPPTTVKETRRFLGMVGFYRKHIEVFAKIATPITNLVRKDTPFIWTELCNQAFETLK